MSAWGTGIRQSDEFADVYEEFYDLYRDDAAAIEIYQKILKRYQDEFCDEESIPLLYTVYYALAQCLWECGEKDQWLWSKIQSIIDSDADVKFWHELGADPGMEKSRRRELRKFWDKIQTTPSKIRKPSKTQKKREPTLHKGDIFAYSDEEGYRAAFVLDFVFDSFLISITEDIFSDIPTVEEVLKAYTHTVVWFTVREVIPKKNRIFISNYPDLKSYNYRAGLLYSGAAYVCSSIGKKEYFFNLESAAICMERNHIGHYMMKDLMNPEILPKTAISSHIGLM